MGYEAYKSRVTGRASRVGQLHKQYSDDVINATWWNDPQSRVAYLYDYKHDHEKDKFRDKDPESNPYREAFDVKLIKTQTESISKDQVEYHLQFRPGELERHYIDYYDDDISNFGATYPVGLYCDIKDESGKYNRWLIIAENGGDQFIKYSILPCNYFFHWIFNGSKHDMCGVCRMRNSYN